MTMVMTKPAKPQTSPDLAMPHPGRLKSLATPDSQQKLSGKKLADQWKKFSSTLGMHTPGWVLFGLGIVAGILGGWLAWIELRYLAVFSLVVVGIALIFTIGRPRYQVLLRLVENRVVVGQVAKGELLVANQANRRTLPARLDLPVGNRQASFILPSLAGGGTFSEEFEIPTDKRQVILVGPAKSVQGDPFYLTGRETNWTQIQELYVHPKTVPIPGRYAGFVHDLEGFAARNLSNSDMSFHALREYVPGDDRRQIHWKSSAKLGQLMVRQYEESLQSRVVVALDVSSSAYLTEDEFELAVSATGSIMLQCFREENPVNLMTSTLVFPTINPMRCLDQLSGVELSGTTPILQLAESVKLADANVSVVFLVTGSGMSISELRKACDSFSLDWRVIGVQINPEEPLSVRTVANQSIIRLDQLANLPRAMRKAME